MPFWKEWCRLCVMVLTRREYWDSDNGWNKKQWERVKPNSKGWISTVNYICQPVMLDSISRNNSCSLCCLIGRGWWRRSMSWLGFPSCFPAVSFIISPSSVCWQPLINLRKAKTDDNLASVFVANLNESVSKYFKTGGLQSLIHVWWILFLSILDSALFEYIFT